MGIESTYRNGWKRRRNLALTTSTALAGSIIAFTIVATVEDYWTGFSLYATLVALIMTAAIADHADLRDDSLRDASVEEGAVPPRRRLRWASRRAITPSRRLRPR